MNRDAIWLCIATLLCACGTGITSVEPTEFAAMGAEQPESSAAAPPKSIDWTECWVRGGRGASELVCPRVIASFNPKFGGPGQVRVMAARESLPDTPIVKETLHVDGRAVEVVRYRRRSDPERYSWLTQLDGRSIVCATTLTHAALCHEVLSLGLRGMLPLEKTGTRPLMGRAVPVGPDCRRLDTLDVRCADKSRFTGESMPDGIRAIETKKKELSLLSVPHSAMETLRCAVDGIDEPVPCWGATICPPGEDPISMVLTVVEYQALQLVLTCSWWEANGPAPGAACQPILKPLGPRFPKLCPDQSVMP